MNREQKIAIIIGFAVILAVGVLLSDHFSRARQLELADATEGDAQQYTQQPVAVLTQPEDIVLPDDPKPQATVLPSPVVITQGEPTHNLPSTSPTGLGDLPSGRNASPLANALESTSNKLTPQANKPSMPQRFNSMVSKLQHSYNKPLPQAARVDQALPNTSTNQSTINHATKPIIVLPTKATNISTNTTTHTPAPIRHKVAKGETLSHIAAKYLGSAKRWREIAKANPRVVASNGSVRQGVILLIPTTTSSKTPPASASSAHHAEQNQTRASKTTTYTVKKGDTLGEIAQKYLGSAKRYIDILKANRDLITDADDIRVGMVLNIPAK